MDSQIFVRKLRAPWMHVYKCSFMQSFYLQEIHLFKNTKLPMQAPELPHSSIPYSVLKSFPHSTSEGQIFQQSER